MNKYQGIPRIALLLVFALTACTRPASYQPQTGEAGTLVSTVAAQPAVPTSIGPATRAPETVTPGATPITSNSPQSTEPTRGIAVPVTQIPLSGPIASPKAEISGMAWYGDLLILLPQYPNRFPINGNASLFALQRSDILDYINRKSSKPLTPIPIPFSASNIEGSIRGFEGFESVAIDGDQVFMTIEASPGGMMGYIIAGRINSDPIQIRMDTSRITQIPPQTRLPNFSDEALLVFGGRLVTIYEVSGEPFNPNPVAHMYDFSLQLQDTLAFPNIPYRVSDATPPDDSGRFWVINFTLRGNEVNKTPTETFLDDLLEEFFQVGTLVQLVELQFSEDGIVPSDRLPIQLELPNSKRNGNWEAIARLDESGFLLATDEHPDTILGFVPSR